MPRTPKWTDLELKAALDLGLNWPHICAELGLTNTSNNRRLLKRHAFVHGWIDQDPDLGREKEKPLTLDD